jgi:hypothetical protein
MTNNNYLTLAKELLHNVIPFLDFMMMNKSEHSHFIKYDELTNAAYINQLGKDLVTLATTPGPSRCIARIADSGPRTDRTERFPMTLIVQDILQRVSYDNKIDVVLREFSGNPVIAGGLGINPTDQEIYDLPVTLSAHADEITYMVKNEWDRETGLQILLPLCAAREIKPENSKVEVLGFRGINERKLVQLGTGTIRMKKVGEVYLLETGLKDIRPGDLVIQGYSYEEPNTHYELKSVVHIKALDDRAGCIAQIYAVAELAKRGIPAKAILVGDEEGVNHDIAWAKLARPAFRKYSRPDGIIIVCDGFDGYRLISEFDSKSGQYLSEALITAYVGGGKGAGDPGIFSLFRDKIVDIVRQSEFEATATTNYASRSFDPKIMDDFPLIAFVDWSNGRVGGKEAVCHEDESILLRQVANVIGVTTLAANYFTSEVISK